MIESQSTFPEAATQAFDFLVGRYGFRIRTSEPYYLRFENEQVYVVVRYDARRSYELGVALGLLSDEDQGLSIPYDLNEMLRVEGFDTERNRIPLTATSPTQLVRFLRQLGEILSAYGNDYLRGDTEKFAALSDFRREETAAYASAQEMKQIRQAVDAAWRSGDYALVVELLGTAQEHLTQAEIKKFQIARKRARGSPNTRK